MLPVDSFYEATNMANKEIQKLKETYTVKEFKTDTQEKNNEKSFIVFVLFEEKNNSNISNMIN